MVRWSPKDSGWHLQGDDFSRFHSPQGRRKRLQSFACSVDNTIIIWNERSDTIVTRLQGHESFVKGLSFDPTGRFLASHGEDLAVLIWKTSDWRIEKEIRETFKESRTVEVFCFIAVHNDKRIHAAVLFHRECNFERPEYFKTSVPVLCVRYSKRMYKSKRDEQVDIGNEAYTAIAFGTASGTLLVWVSKSSKALLALKNACQGPILISFTEEELGYVSTAKEEKQVLMMCVVMRGANYENVPLTQSTVQLEMEGLYEAYARKGYLQIK
ncbi:Protein HIRA [Galdieria sulphuraria]|nr:Protein HIRA [Galdieria sulphuraria]